MDVRFDTLHFSSFALLLSVHQSIIFCLKLNKKEYEHIRIQQNFKQDCKDSCPSVEHVRTLSRFISVALFLSWYSLSWHAATPSRVGNSSSIIMARSWWHHRGNLLLRQSASTHDWTPRRILVQHTQFLHWTLPPDFQPWPVGDPWVGAMEAIASPKKVRKIFLNVSEKNPATGNCL